MSLIRNALYGSYGLVLMPPVLAEVYFILLRSFSRSLHRTVLTFIREFVLRVLQTSPVDRGAGLAPHALRCLHQLDAAIFLVCTLFAGVRPEACRAPSTGLGSTLVATAIAARA